MIEISFMLNGSAVTAFAAPGDLLIDLLRRRLGQTGTREGCGQGECGACTVLVDGRTVNSCLFPAPEVEGRSVVTIEGLSAGIELSPLQRAFVEHGGIQCGFCTPGMILSAKALLDRNPEPTDDEIREALAGNLCRCTGYVQIVESVRQAAAALRAEGEGG
ncbi:MAG: (2Fe-2S)-binding protein [bacterium]|nr:(2Fe-2S)-binding protein [bacterium]